MSRVVVFGLILHPCTNLLGLVSSSVFLCARVVSILNCVLAVVE